MRRKTYYIVLTMSIVCMLFFGRPALAQSSVYENSYNIDAAISYANRYAKEYNKKYNYYEYDEKKKAGGDCTNFVSQCIADDEGGGILREGRFNKDNEADGWTKFWNRDKHPWTCAPDLLNLLKERGYDCISFSNKYSESKKNSVHPGDVIIYDWYNDGIIDHSAICVGYKKGIPTIAAHTEEVLGENYDYYSKSYPNYTIYVVHMTNLKTAVDVSSNFVGKKIKIKSIEVNQYVSSNTSVKNAQGVDVVADRNTASTWEYFEVTEGDYGAIGLKACGNNSYLSTRIDENKNSAPVRACASNYQSYETFRIYEYDGVQYIQSQVNGKFLQVIANNDQHQVKAGGSFMGDWEGFIISIVQ